MTSELNPRIKKVQVGIKELHEVSIYPLSFGDELAVTDSIVDIVNKFLSTRVAEQTEVLFVTLLVEAIKNNVLEFIKLVIDYDEWRSFCDDENKVLKFIDNYQLAEIIDIIKEANFGEDLRKKAMSLIKGISEAIVETPEEVENQESLSGEQLPQS